MHAEGAQVLRREVGGQRLYKLSRKGIEVERPEREVCIHFDHAPFLRTGRKRVLDISCSKGTYIRQLAADHRTKAGSGARSFRL